jgi:transcriptional regulator with XRE-family HTH domain
MRTYGASLPEFIKILRKDKDWTMEALGKKLGVSKQYVHQVESGIYPSVPVRFVVGLMPLCEKERRAWLEDLLVESSGEWLAERLRRKA